MSDRSLPAIFVACVSLLFLFAFPQVSHSQGINFDSPSAGNKLPITPYKAGGMPSWGGMPRGGGMGGIGGMIGMMMLQSVVTGAMQGGNAQLTQQQAQLSAWMQAQQQQLANLIQQQRAARDALDQQTSAENIAAMSDGAAPAAPGSDLASALSDPNAVISNPGGTPFFGDGGGSANNDVFALAPVQPPVDLSQATSNVPNIPGNQSQIAVRQVQIRVQAAKKLQTMIKENHNPKILNQRLQTLEQELAEALRQAQELRDKFNATGKDYELLDQELASLTPALLHRGLSLALDFGAVETSGEILGRLTKLRANQDEWEKTMHALNLIDSAVSMSAGSIQYSLSEKTLDDALDLIGTSLQTGLPGPYYSLGKIMVDTALDIHKGSVDLQGLEGTTKAYFGKLQQINGQIKRITKAIHEERQQLALKPGVSASSN